MELEEMKTFGEEIRSYRESKGLTQRAFAEMLGISQPQLANIERGKEKTVGRRMEAKLRSAITSGGGQTVFAYKHNVIAQHMNEPTMADVNLSPLIDLVLSDNFEKTLSMLSETLHIDKKEAAEILFKKTLSKGNVL